MMKLSFATNNIHKVAEAQYILKNYEIYLEPVNVEKIEIQSDSLDDIATYAAINAYKQIRRPVIVEDSGLFIEVLNGFPGPYSNYVYKTIGLQGILKLLQGEVNRRAQFVCVVAIALDEYNVYLFKGVSEGVISYEVRGNKGFGFDPIFIPTDGDGRTFAEMDMEEKCRCSHRGKAFNILGRWIYMNRDKLKYILS